jgi:hypothetical protein
MWTLIRGATAVARTGKRLWTTKGPLCEPANPAASAPALAHPTTPYSNNPK